MKRTILLLWLICLSVLLASAAAYADDGVTTGGTPEDAASETAVPSAAPTNAPSARETRPSEPEKTAAPAEQGETTATPSPTAANAPTATADPYAMDGVQLPGTPEQSDAAPAASVETAVPLPAEPAQSGAAPWLLPVLLCAAGIAAGIVLFAIIRARKK